MTVAKKLKEHLAGTGVDYEVVKHPRTYSSSTTAQAAHVSGEHLAKSVVLHDEEGYFLAVVPSTHRVELHTIHDLTKRQLNLASEGEIATLFADCDVGAVPPLGAAYGIEVVLDESLSDLPDVYFEAGDHESLIRVSGKGFAALAAECRRGRISHHA